MAKRVYNQTIKKWALIVGIPSGIAGFTLLFLYLSAFGVIEVVSYSGDTICEGTLNDPCIASMEFIAKEDIFIYPTEYDPWGRNTPFETDKALDSWKIYRSWGKGWREIKLDQRCTATWCGAPPKSPDNQYAFAFREGKTYNIKIVALKKDPKETIKWSFTKEIDPFWYGIGAINFSSNVSEIYMELGSQINISANISGVSTVCVSIDHPDYNDSYACGSPNAVFQFNISYFRKDKFNNVTCYQEYSNESSGCGDLSNGSYDFSNDYNNGIWDDYFVPVGAYLINYTVPDNYYGATWNLAGQNCDSFGDCTAYEKEIELPSSCLSGNTLQLKTELLSCPRSFVNYTCYDSINWIAIEGSGDCGSLNTQTISEEAVIWGLDNVEKDVNFTFYPRIENKTVYILAHQYDDIVNVTINLSGDSYSGSFLKDVKIYINNTLSNYVGLLNKDNVLLNTINTSNSNIEFSYQGLETKISHLNIPLNVNVTNAYMNVSARKKSQFNSSSNNISISGSSSALYLSTNDTAIYYYSSGPSTIIQIRDIDTGGLIQNYNVCNPNCFGIDLNESNVFVVHNPETGGPPSSEKNITKYTTDFTFIDSISLNSENSDPRGLAFNGSYFYVGDSVDDLIYEYDTLGNLINTRQISSGFNDFTFKEDYFYVSYQSDFIIRKYDSLWNFIETIPINSSIEDISNVWGIAYKNNTFWLGTDNLNVLYAFYPTEYPVNTSIEIGVVDGVREWVYNGEFNHSDNKTSDFSDALNNYISAPCTADSNGFCSIPIYLTSIGGAVRLSDFNINYTRTSNLYSLDLGLIRSFFGNNTENSYLPITFTSKSKGILIIEDIRFDYAGGNDTIEVLVYGGGTTDHSLLIFNNSLQTENLTFSTNENFTRYLEISPLADITSAFMNFSGIENYFFTISEFKTEDPDLLTYSGDTGGGACDSNPGSALCSTDNDWSTPADCNGLNCNGVIYHAWNINESVTGLNITFKINVWSGIGSSKAVSIKIYNTTDWFEVGNCTKMYDQMGGDSATNCADSSWKFSTHTIEYDVPNELINEPSFNMSWQTQDGSLHDIFLYETNLTIFNKTLNGTSQNPWMSIGGNQIWNFTGNFNQTNNKSVDLSYTIDLALNSGSCDCTGCILNTNCTIPFEFHSDSIGRFNYDWQNIDYNLGSDKSVNETLSIITYFSKWDFNFPKFINFFEMIPRFPTDKNVAPFGQTPSKPIFNFTTLNYGGKNMNLSIYLNGTEQTQCVDLIWNTNSTKPGTVQVPVITELYDDFESDFGHWDDNLGINCPTVDAWGQRGTSTVSSSTGPQNGGVGGAGTYFIYVEASSGSCYDPGDIALVTFNTSLNYDTYTNEKIEFYFNGYGVEIDDLYLEENSTGSWVKLWEMHDENNDFWNFTQVDLTSLSGNGTLRFNYTRTSSGYRSDIALDRINVSYSTESNDTQINALSSEWSNIATDLEYNNNTQVWLWADYSCNYTTWQNWFPDIFVRGCGTDLICSEDLV